MERGGKRASVRVTPKQEDWRSFSTDVARRRIAGWLARAFQLPACVGDAATLRC